MEYLASGFWEAMTDLTCLFLCFMTFVYLIIIKFKSKRNRPVYSEINNPGILSDTFVFQLLKQQSKKSFDAIIDSVNAERRVLEDLFENPKNEQTIGSGTQKLKKPTTGELSTRHHGQIVNLADQGLNALEISKKTKMPKGEIELIMKLKNMGHKGEKASHDLSVMRGASSP